MPRPLAWFIVLGLPTAVLYNLWSLSPFLFLFVAGLLGFCAGLYLFIYALAELVGPKG